jgi:hypothetical protein
MYFNQAWVVLRSSSGSHLGPTHVFAEIKTGELLHHSLGTLLVWKYYLTDFGMYLAILGNVVSDLNDL